MAFRKQGALIERVNSTATAAGTTTLLNNSITYQQFTGTTTQTVVLPDATTCPIGLQFTILNRSTGAVTVNFNGGSLAKLIAAGTQATFRIISNGSSAGTWDVSNETSGASTVSLSALEKLGALAALSSTLYGDSQANTKILNISPEEMGGDYWITTTALPVTIEQGGFFSLNNFGYSTGGLDTSSHTYTSSLRFNDDTSFWTVKTGPNAARFGHGAYENGMVAGGFNSVVLTSSELYNDSLDSWATKSSLPTGNYYSGAFFLSGYPYICGGSNGANNKLVESYSVASDVWVTRQPMTNAHAEATSGYVSGFGYVAMDTSFTTGSERYNDILNVWTTFASLATGRSGAADFVSSGAWYVAGGYTGSASAVVEENVPDLGAIFRTKTSLSTARNGFNHGISLNGLGYAVGGAIGATVQSIVEQYKNFNYFSMGSFAKSNVAPSSLYVAVALNNNAFLNVPVQVRTDGDVWKYLNGNKDSAIKNGETLSTKLQPAGTGYATGGAAGGAPFTVAERYNIAANTWEVRTSLGTGTTQAAGLYLNGLGYTIGGFDNVSTAFNTNYQYDEIVNAYTAKAVLTSARCSMPGLGLNGFGYIWGGQNTGTFTEQSTNYQYNPTLDSWATKAALLFADSQFGVFNTYNQGFMFGGHAFASATNATSYYNDAADSWTAKATMATARHAPAGISLNGFGYAVAGYSPGPAILNSVEKYNVLTNAWSTLSSTLNTTRGRHGSFMAGGYGHVMGGEIGAYTATTEQYNDASSVWTNKTSMGTARSFLSSDAPGPYRNYEIRVGVPAYLISGTNIQFITKASLATNRAQSNGGYVGGKEISTGNGNNTMEYYDRFLNAWLFGPSPSNVGGNSQHGFNLYGFWYAMGTPSNSGTQNFNFDVNAWTTRATENQPRAAMGPSAGQTLNGFGLIGGGGDNGGTTTYPAEESYNSVTNAWTTKASRSNTSTNYASAFIADGFLFALPGMEASRTTGSNGVDRFNDSSNSWVTRNVYPLSSFDTGYGVNINGTPYALTGRASTSSTANCYRYNPGIDSFTSITNYPVATNYIGGAPSGLFFGGTATTNSAYQFVDSVKDFILGAGLRVS